MDLKLLQTHTVHPRLSKPQLFDYPNAKFHKPHRHYKSHVGLDDCEILQYGIFQSAKATQSAENVLIIEENWVFTSSWLQIDPIRSTTEVDNRL